MPTLSCLENKIELLRLKMYEAYNNSTEYEEIVKISQELDDLLNKLEKIKDIERAHRT